MLPVYQAASFQRVIEKGGRTRPWSVLVTTENGLKPYVVKMFTTRLIEERNSVVNEVLGNVLAQQFDLPVPKAALIEMDPQFEWTISDPSAQILFDNIDSRVKFGSELIEGNYLFNPAFTKAQAVRMIEIDSLFAFDQLIRNRDRTDGKPNLLVKGRSAFLIDHELAFGINDKTFDDFIHNRWGADLYNYHICLKYLKRGRKSTKSQHFETFRENLRLLNHNCIDPYTKQLGDYGFNISFTPSLSKYLIGMKQNSGSFVNFLKSTL